MKKDIFKGNIQKQYINYVKFSIVFAIVLFGVFAIFFFLFALLYEKIEPAARVMMFVGSGACLISSICYPLLTIFAIKTYPKHMRLAHGMLKEFVFETNETRVINNLKENEKLSAADFPSSYDLTTDNIINHIPSKEIRKYLLKHKKKISIMQYATLVENYYKGNMVAILEALKDFSDNEFEKELFTIAMKDYRKYKRIEKRTMDFYEQNDPREKKLMCPFEEFIYLPTLFKEYDLALLLGEQPKIVMIGRNIKFDENDNEDNKKYDFSDLSYMAYDLDTAFGISEENLVNIHVHAHYCELEKVGNSNLTSKQLENYSKLTKVLKEYYKNEENHNG
ncbi:MAG: hypothetical protein MR270_02260 [Erysipelotrichaceae bacterium]|nr:hypothetical protein [Erysipelotrichaceae bacterium]